MGITLIHADDHELFRHGVKTALASYSNIRTIYPACNGLELLSLLEQNIIPDIILLDIQMPIMNGIETLKQITKSYPKTKTIMLSMHDAPSVIADCQNLGAMGYLSKNVTIPDIITAIETVMGNVPFFQSIGRKTI